VAVRVNRTVTYVNAAGKLRPAIVTALGAGDQVSVRVGHHSETYVDADLMTNSDDVSVWYPGSRRKYPHS
jgi:hypothetical protein